MAGVRGVCILLALTLSVLPANADHGNDSYKLGMKAEHEANVDGALGYYKEAYSLAPKNPKYLAAYTRVRFAAATNHVHRGELLRNTGALTEALTEFQRAVDIDSSSFVAQQELRQTADLIRRQEKRSAPPLESPLAKMAGELPESVELQSISNAPITFHMTANADVAYKTICRLAGINVLMDPDYKPQKITIDLNDVTLRQALDMVRLQSKTYWKPVLTNTIFVSGDSAAKRKELEQNVMKTFYLRNITTQNELQEAANVIRQILDVGRVQLLQAQDALVVRGTMDQMILVEKLLSDIDKPKSEVMIDVAVMQVSRDRLRTLGTNVPTAGGIAYLPNGSQGSGGSNGSGGSGGSVTPYTLHLGNFAITLPTSASFTALASDSNTKVLQNPEIRVLNNEKATLRIGDRVPIATGSFQPGIVGGGGVSPLVSTQFQYLDVGVNIDITPHIHSDREVTLKMSLEISSVTGSQNIGGITQPVIGQRRIEHETRLIDGEINLLGGILEDSETQSLSGYPWISRVPILKYLFAQENKDRQESEIVFAITPHIVRAQELTEENLRLVEVGTGSSIELHRNASAAPPSKTETGPAADKTHPAAADKQPSGSAPSSHPATDAGRNTPVPKKPGAP
jgi:general secretion pathway protein D